MLLAIDVGNTNITLGLFQGKKLIRELRLKTNTFRKLPKLNWNKIRWAIISSVVPNVDTKLKRQLKCQYKFISAKKLIMEYSPKPITPYLIQ